MICLSLSVNSWQSLSSQTLKFTLLHAGHWSPPALGCAGGNSKGSLCLQGGSFAASPPEAEGGQPQQALDRCSPGDLVLHWGLTRHAPSVGSASPELDASDWLLQSGPSIWRIWLWMSSVPVDLRRAGLVLSWNSGTTHKAHFPTVGSGFSGLGRQAISPGILPVPAPCNLMEGCFCTP